MRPESAREPSPRRDPPSRRAVNSSPRPARGRTLATAGEHDSSALGPIELAVVDRAVLLARDQQILGEPEGASSYPRSPRASSLTMLGQMLCCRTPLTRTDTLPSLAAGELAGSISRRGTAWGSDRLVEPRPSWRAKRPRRCGRRAGRAEGGRTFDRTLDPAHASDQRRATELDQAVRSPTWIVMRSTQRGGIGARSARHFCAPWPRTDLTGCP
jgi:hypothetical protein